MSEVKQLPKRNELSVELTWDLSVIYPDDATFETEFKSISKQLEEIGKYKGTLGKGATELLAGIDEELALYRRFEKLYVYSHLKNDQDTGNATYQAMNDKASSLAASISAATAFFEPEILAIPEKDLSKMLNSNSKLREYRHFLEDLTSTREHVLSIEEEAILAGASDIFSASSKTFNVLNNADLKFPIVKDDEGQAIQLSHGVYGKLLESTDSEVRREAFEKLASVYQQFIHTTASTLSSHVKMHNFLAKTRHYSSARQSSLSANHIPEKVYDTLVSVVNSHLPLLHRYVALRKKVLGVEKLHSYDLYTPILGEAPVSYTFEEAKKKALESMHVMGTEYLDIVDEAFNNRWIDVVENQGKRSGAYSSGMYDTNPYMLLNWRDSIDNLYTLVHEMGHSAHSYLTHKYQPYVYGDYSIFLAEIASTTNENNLTDYLLKTETDPKMRAYVLNHYLDGFKGTVFRQTQFAEFEHFIHVQDAAGVPLTADYLSQYYGDLNRKYYGKALERDEGISVEWSRIPHFYYNYYVFQYSTGFAAASTLSKRITEHQPAALDNYLNYLKSGNSAYPIDVMKKAGVDMTQATYLEEAFKVFESRLDEFEALIAKL